VVEPARHTFHCHDGLTLVYHEAGSGRPVVRVTGDHLTTLLGPQFRDEIAAFLAVR
jgi:hypothetical protein